MTNLYMNRILLIGAVLLMSIPSFAKEKEGVEDKPQASYKRLKARCVNASAQVDLDINNVRARIMNGGDLWWDLVGNPKYEVPKIDVSSGEASRHSLFAGSIWIGGLYNGNIHTAAQTYRQFGGNDMWPGPIDTSSVSIDDADCEYWDKIFQVTREEIDAHIAQFEDNSGQIDITDNIRSWPGNGRTDDDHREANFMAPYVNVAGTPKYEPDLGDYPDVKGDKALWFVYNDVGNLKTETSSPEIGLEFRTMAFAFATNDEINNMTFYETTIYNRGAKQLDSTFFGQWVDADLGYAFDDYVGCDVDRGLGICFNGDNFDEGAFGYGSNPPSIGVDFFEGPKADLDVVGDGIDNDNDGLIDETDTTYYYYYRQMGLPLPTVYEGDGIDNNRNDMVDEPYEDITMSKFVYYNNDFTTIGNPSNFVHFYNYLIGNWKNGDCIRYGGNGFTSATGGCSDFMFPDDPRNPTGWSEVTSNNQPADRRFLQSAGPFTMKPGAVNTVTVGVVWARATSGGNTGSYDLLLLADDKAQKLFNNEFKLLSGPDAPDLRGVEMDRELVLIMDREDYVETEQYRESEVTTTNNTVVYTFQGYQLYQLANANVSNNELSNVDLAREVWQSDVDDGIANLVNVEFDPTVAAGIPVPKVSGNDEGVSHVIRITEDAFASGNSQLINNKTYHYLLVAYASADKESASEDRQYLDGRVSFRISLTPTKTESKFGGTKLNAQFGSGPIIKRIEGIGNGGQILELTSESDSIILADGEYTTPSYKGGFGPLNIKVIDPFRIPSNRFVLKFKDPSIPSDTNLSWIPLISSISAQSATVEARTEELKFAEADLQTEANKLQIVGNTLNRLSDSLTVIDSLINDPSTTFEDSTYYASIQIVIERSITTYEIALNDSVAFKSAQSNVKTITNQLNNALSTYNKRVEDADSVIWELTMYDANNEVDTVVVSEKALYTDNEMILDEWGLAIKAGPVYGPMGSAEDPNNGLLYSSLEFEDASTKWLTALPDRDGIGTENNPDPLDWIRAGGNFPEGNQNSDVIFQDAETTSNQHLDDKGIYESVADGIIAPYVLTSRSKEVNNNSTYGIAQSSSYGLETQNFPYLPSINLVLTSDRSKWSRVAVVEMGEDEGRTEGNAPKFHLRRHPSLMLEPDADGNPVYSTNPEDYGFSWFPGYAINVETGQRLNIILGENSMLEMDKAKDMIWNPTSQLVDPDIPYTVDGGLVAGGMHYVYVMGTRSDFKNGSPDGGSYESAYDGCASYKKYLDNTTPGYKAVWTQGVFAGCAWVMPAMLAPTFNLLSWKDGLVPTTTTIKTRINRPYQTYVTSDNQENGFQPMYEFNTGNIVPEYAAQHGTDALKNIRVVPNPYYAQSSYERTQLDNIVKLTNLPARCNISIFTVNGQLVRRFIKDETDETHNTELQWDLKNDFGVPIAGGAYVIHVDAYDLGSSTLKFFAVLRPLDLDTF